MDVLKKVARTVRGYSTEGSLQSFYGAIASRDPHDAPQFSETKRDFAALRHNSDRFMLF